MVFAFTRSTREHKLPAVVLVLDLSTAFDKLVREVAFGVRRVGGGQERHCRCRPQCRGG